MCTFTMQQSAGGHGHCLAISRKQCLEPSIRTLESSRINSMAYQQQPTWCCILLQVGPQSPQGKMPMSPEGCHHLPTYARNSRLRLATATNHQGFEDRCDFFSKIQRHFAIQHDSDCTVTKRKVCLGPGTKIQASCFIEIARKYCGLVRSTWGTSLGGDKLGARDRMLNTKVARRSCAGQTFPLSVRVGGVGPGKDAGGGEA